MDPPRPTFTVRDRTIYCRLADGELIPLRRWTALHEQHRDCCLACPVRKRLEGR